MNKQKKKKVGNIKHKEQTLKGKNCSIFNSQQYSQQLRNKTRIHTSNTQQHMEFKKEK